MIEHIHSRAARLFAAMVWLTALFVPTGMPRANAQAPVPAPAAPQQAVATAPTVDSPAQIIATAEGDYVLTSGDTIEMTIFREPELTSRSIIASDGTAQLPLIKETKLAGMTVRDARDYLTKLYGEKYLVNPQIYLTVTNFAQRRFTILGQVNRPGTYELQGGRPLDLLEAIGAAGGFTRIADQGRVLIRRQTGEGIELLRANAKRMSQGKAAAILVKPGDIITVGESWF